MHRVERAEKEPYPEAYFSGRQKNVEQVSHVVCRFLLGHGFPHEMSYYLPS
jgi:hypothetical protein